MFLKEIIHILLRVLYFNLGIWEQYENDAVDFLM